MSLQKTIVVSHPKQRTLLAACSILAKGKGQTSNDIKQQEYGSRIERGWRRVDSVDIELVYDLGSV